MSAVVLASIEDADGDRVAVAATDEGAFGLVAFKGGEAAPCMAVNLDLEAVDTLVQALEAVQMRLMTRAPKGADDAR